MKKIYLVGGAVRDRLLNKPVSDKDYVAVGYEASDFSHLPRVGKDFEVFLLENGAQLALARTERKTGHGYNGFSSNTKNVTLEQDLSRRDLTINSIAYDEQTGEYIDPFGGMADLERKILRHTSPSFTEDPLRVVRLARFRARLGAAWRISDETKRLVLSMKQELAFLEKNRVYKEVQRVLETPNAHIFFETLAELGVLADVFPLIGSLSKAKFLRGVELLRVLAANSALLKLTAIYHDAPLEKGLDILLPKKLEKKLFFLIGAYPKILSIQEQTPEQIAEFLAGFKKDGTLLEDLLSFCRALETVAGGQRARATAGGQVQANSLAPEQMALEQTAGQETAQAQAAQDKKASTQTALDQTAGVTPAGANHVSTNRAQTSQEALAAKLSRAYARISSYSPQSWIAAQSLPPPAQKIAAHIRQKNLELVQEAFGKGGALDTPHA